MKLLFSLYEILRVVSHYTGLAIILLDFVLKKEETYHPQAFLKESKCLCNVSFDGAIFIIHFLTEQF